MTLKCRRGGGRGGVYLWNVGILSCGEAKLSTGSTGVYGGLRGLQVAIMVT